MPSRQTHPNSSRSGPTPFAPGALWRWPLARDLSWTDRQLIRVLARLALTQVVAVDGWERLLPSHDPFILIANHSSRREALYLPALFLLVRSGKPIRFLADWNYRLYPGVGYLYDHSGAITVTRKPARPRWLNRFKRRYENAESPLDVARDTLLQGGSIGLYPEGTVNRSALRLLRGRYGAARLSLELEVPLLPVGLRFGDGRSVKGQIDSNAPLRILVGEPLHPTVTDAEVSPREVRDWHREAMNALSALCDKAWLVQEASPTDPVQDPDKGVRGGLAC